MNFDVLSFLYENLEASGVIGGYVALSLVVVNVLTHISNKSLTEKVLSAPKWSHSIIGALLGVIPGCGGTIVASTLYNNNKLSFGGLLAAFITTLGEGSFVLLGASSEADVAANLKAFVIVNIIGGAVGIVVGIVTDAFNFKGVQKVNKATPELLDIHDEPHSLFQTITEKLGLFLVLGIALFLAPGSIMALWGGGVESIEDMTVVACVLLTVISILYYLVQTFLLDGHCHSESHTDLKSVLLESVIDITMVITYVFVGLVVANFVIEVIVGPEQFKEWMSSSALLVVVIAALIGATPGCGGMITVAVAYISIQDFPIAALISAGIATSGDGIFPLLANNKKDALLITGISIVIALVVGYGALLFGL